MRTTKAILKEITKKTGSGECPLGFAIFLSDEVLHNEDLHRNYDYSAAVRYLMRIRPVDVAWLESETNVELSDHSGPGHPKTIYLPD